jgi:hypothetical protein
MPKAGKLFTTSNLGMPLKKRVNICRNCFENSCSVSYYPPFKGYQTNPENKILA